MIRKRLRFTLAAAAAATLAVAAALTVGAPASLAAGPAKAAIPAAGPSADQILAKAQNCTPASNGEYATDDGEPSTVEICKNGSAYTWTSDMDIDCDGITTSHCNSSTDPSYFDETSFQTSTGDFFTSDVTHYFVIPLPSSRFSYENAGISPGSVAAVVYNGKVAYATFADEGPDNIIGEGSYSLATALGIDPDPATGGTEGPVTFVVFPGQVPNPVEDNTTIDSVGGSAATAWVGDSGGSGGTTPPSGGGMITGYGGKCVDVAGGSSANGTAVQLYTCNGSTAQTWTASSGNTLKALGKCLDVAAAGTANGSKVQLYDCNGTAAQQWTRNGSTLVNAGSGKCLDATGPSSADGTRLQIWSCTGAANQSWTVTS